MPLKIHLLRHGQTQDNQAGIVIGWGESNLSPEGQRQIQKSAQDFNTKVEAIFCSDLTRTRESVIPFISKFPELDLFYDWRIRERSVGDAEGKKSEDYDWNEFWTSEDGGVDNAEKLSIMEKRLKSFIKDLFEFGYSEVLIVTHGGVIQSIIRMMDPENYKYKEVENGGIVSLSLEKSL
jgi:broad specificity phosphatase PhoE